MRELLVEQRVHYNADLWGTADALVFKPKHMDVVDLKTGAGVKVYAANNGQGLCYAVMARREWGPIYGPFETISIHIVQPPLDHIDVWTITAAELDQFEEQLETILARIASGDRSAHPDEKACQWCKGKAVCRPRAEHNLAVIRTDFAAPITLSMEEIAELLPKMGQISKWCATIEEYAFNQAEKGIDVPGFKLVTGRSNRVWRDEAAAAEALSLSGIPEAKLWKKKIIGITDAEKALGKSHPVFQEQCVKPEGKPTLVPEKDPRPAISQQAEDFTAVI